MTNWEMRYAIAERCGWSKIIFAGIFAWQKDGDPKMVRGSCPNYPDDLNAMAEARKSLTVEERQKFGEALCKLVPNQFGFLLYVKHPWTGLNVFELVDATASQQAEAFCRVFWPERFNEKENK